MKKHWQRVVAVCAPHVKACVSWLLNGSDIQFVDKAWLTSDRLPAHEAWTIGQLNQGAVVRKVEELRQENERIIAEREQRLAMMEPSKVVRPKFGAKR